MWIKENTASDTQIFIESLFRLSMAVYSVANNLSLLEAEAGG